MTQSPLLLVLMIAASCYVIRLWRSDYVAAKSGRPDPRALPGATQASVAACAVAAAGALAILAAETFGEIRLGLSGEQSQVTVLFGAYSLTAAFVEEIVFRGFLVIDGRGPRWRWAGVAAASVLFAALHPFLWNWHGGWLGGGIDFTPTTKGWFSTGVIFLSSLWFYTARFARFNPRHSLLPCFAAHAAMNLGVFVIKAKEGFVAGWW